MGVGTELVKRRVGWISQMRSIAIVVWCRIMSLDYHFTLGQPSLRTGRNAMRCLKRSLKVISIFALIAIADRGRAKQFVRFDVTFNYSKEEDRLGNQRQ
jgi:hypothetical protein